MANTNLTIDMITNEALKIAHEKLSFIGTVNRSYDDSYAKSGAKIGDTLRIRLPMEYTVRSGKDANVQDSSEEKVDLVVATQKGVDMAFSSAERALDIDMFSERYIQPAMARLASNIESSMLNYVTPKVWNAVGTPGTLPTFAQIGLGKAKLNQSLAPKDDNRFLQMESVDMVGLVNEVKPLFHDSKEIAKQYRDGVMGRAFGLNWVENERVYVHTVGADSSGTINDTLVSGDTTVTTSSVTMAVGDVFDFGATCKAVHPETKATMAHNAQFVCTAIGGANDYTFSPAIISSGAKQNVSGLPASGQAVTVIGTAAGVYPNHLIYHKDAFVFATADLPLPANTEASRKNFDGISIRIVSQYSAVTDIEITRIDILHGYEAIRPAWACRVYGDS